MKKYTAIVLCLMFALMFASCGKKGKVDYSAISTDSVEINEELESKKIARADGSYNVQYFSDSDNLKYDTICDYDGEGNLEKCHKYEYDENGNCIGDTIYGEGGVYESGTAYEYDENGTLLKIYYYDENGEMEYFEQREYDADGNLVAAPLIDKDGVTLADGKRDSLTTTKKAAEKTTEKAAKKEAAKTTANEEK